MKINANYRNVKESYLFADIAHRVQIFREENPSAEIIRMGIGDVTRPLCPAVIRAMHSAVDEMAAAESFRGYGPEQGYDFLREKIREYYLLKNVSLKPDEIFISDGAKSDLGNILDLFDTDNRVLIPDPVYPVYVDTNIMAGRSVSFMKAGEENGFLPLPDDNICADIIYLCSPNNPTGAVYSREQLKKWVDYANERGAIILFDAAYEAFVADKELPRSIYEISGAETCAIEFCSFSKTAGFTGTRCGYTVVPHTLGELRAMWLRRQTTKFNGTAYIIQRAAEAVFSDEGQRQVRESIEYYRGNAAVITKALDSAGIYYTGGANSPYIWLKCPDGRSSWDYFDYLLKSFGIVGTPGAGFGENGEGFFRLTAFSTRENTQRAMKLISGIRE